MTEDRGLVRTLHAGNSLGERGADEDSIAPRDRRRRCGDGTTDIMNAERFVEDHGEDLSYCSAWGKWLVWDGRRWRPDDAEHVSLKAQQTARRIFLESKDRRVESAPRVEAMIRLARARLVIRPDELDRDPHLLNCHNGTVDLRSGELRRHDRQDFITKLAGVNFPRRLRLAHVFEKFLRIVFGGDEALIGYVQRLLGMCLTGDIKEQILPIFWGGGSNGKSTLLDIVRHVMGEYAIVAPPELLTASTGDRHPTELADLAGRRLACASETEEGRPLRIQLVKSLTGDAKLKGRFMRQDFFEFPRTHKTLLVTNNRPVIPESSHAIWRRLKLIPFTVTIPDDQQDKDMPEKLKAEAPVILAWLVAGCLAWQADGLQEPEIVTAATSTYRQEQDVIGEFLEERCIIASELRVSRPAIFTAYQQWAEDRKERRPLDRKTFYDRLRASGFGEVRFKEHGTAVNGFQGIGLACHGGENSA